MFWIANFFHDQLKIVTGFFKMNWMYTTGTEAYLLPLCRGTAFKLFFFRRINKKLPINWFVFHTEICHYSKNIFATDKIFFLNKKWHNSFSIFRYQENDVSGANKWFSFNVGPNNSLFFTRTIVITMVFRLSTGH